jgi:LDH2 family malate/lactate/ureidoglycolate dehydrogenase
VILPGEVEFGRMEQREHDGVPLSRETIEGLRGLARELKVAFPL